MTELERHNCDDFGIYELCFIDQLMNFSVDINFSLTIKLGGPITVSTCISIVLLKGQSLINYYDLLVIVM